MEDSFCCKGAADKERQRDVVWVSRGRHEDNQPPHIVRELSKGRVWNIRQAGSFLAPLGSYLVWREMCSLYLLKW